MQIDFLLKALEAKDETRTGWAVRSVTDPESVAAHSWGAAVLAFLLADDAGVDRETAVEMALLHDIHEAVSGDIMSSGLTEEEWMEKKEREEAGFETLLELGGSDHERMQQLWEEYEARETATARFVKDVDLLDTVLQALHYRRQERYADEDTFFREYDGMEEFFEGARDALHTDAARAVFDDVRGRYEKVNR